MKDKIIGHLRKYRKVYIAFVLLAGIFALISWSLRPEDHYSRTFQAEDLILNAQTNHISAESGYAGIVTSGPAVSLPAGTYDITIFYEASENGNFIQLWDAEQAGTMTIDGILPQGNGSHTVRVCYEVPVSELEVCTFYGGSGDFTVKSVTISCVEGAANVKDSVVIPILLYIAAVLGYMLCRRLSESDRVAVVVLGLVVLLASMPCYMNYLVSGHDMPFETNRITGIASGLRCGQFPVRIHADTFSGYGYAVSVFYPELFLYFPAVLYALGVSLSTSVHIYLLVLNMLSAGIMYFSASRIFGSKKIGLYSAVIYTMAIYRLVLIYLMNGYGSAAAMVFLPLVIYGFYEIMLGNRKRLGYLVIGMSGVLQSHILSFAVAVFFLGIAVVISLVRVREWKRYVSLAKAAGMTVLLNLWFLVPFLQFYFSGLDTSSLAGNPAARALSLQNLFQVWAHLGFGIQYVNTPATGVPAILDLSIWSGLMCMIWYLVSTKKETGGQEEDQKQACFRRNAVLLLGIGLLALYMTTKYFPWSRIQENETLAKAAAFLQHPQRILCVAVPCLAMAAAYGYERLKVRTQSTVLILLILSALPGMLFLQEYSSQDIRCYQGEIMSTNTETKEYLYPGTDVTELVSNQYLVSDESIEIEAFQKDGTNLSFRYSAGQDGTVTLPLFYYEGYRVECEGEPVTLFRGDNNRIGITVYQGNEGNVRVFFKEPVLWRMADIISLCAIIVSILFLVRNKDSERKKRRVSKDVLAAGKSIIKGEN